MALRRLPSDTSSLSTLSEEFTINILNRINDEDVSNDACARGADVIIARYPALQTEEVPMGTIKKLIAVDVIKAMIDAAPHDRGKRYVHCAILCCDRYADILGLAKDWASYVLATFRNCYAIPPTPMSAEISTPTLHQTEVDMELVPQHRPTSFAIKLSERQGRLCAVLSHGAPKSYYEGSHIIRRSIAAETQDGALRPSLPATWDILRHYMDLSEAFVQKLDEVIDDPENGMLLEITLHKGFDRFDWYLEETETPNKYYVKWFSDPVDIYRFVFQENGTLRNPVVVTFEDSSGTGIALPNPLYLKIHATIAKVLHLSGGAEAQDLPEHMFPDPIEELKSAVWNMLPINRRSNSIAVRG